MTTTPVGPSGPAHVPEKPAAHNAQQPTASQEDAARFSKALDNKPKDNAPSSEPARGNQGSSTMNDTSALFRRREAPEQQQQRGHGDNRGRDSDKTKEKDRPEANPANAILQNMMPKDAVEEAKAVDAPQPVPQSSLNDVVQQVADRILVGESSETGQTEVRITLKDNVLNGTEIRISENAGAYEVTFVADNKDVENFLANRQEQLSTALGEKLDREIKVAVTDRDGTPNQQGDERGRQQGQGQPGDGRSRNQRSVEDEREG
jgi:type III secretion system needle length determinant